MIRGRKPKPTHLHLVNGNPGKRKRKSEPQPPRGIPPAPATLSKRAAEYWPRFAKRIDEMRILTLADEFALELLVEIYAEWQEHKDALKKGRYRTMKATSGSKKIVVHAAQVWVASAQQRFERMLAHFGLSPMTRSRINPLDDPDSGKKDPTAKFFD